MFQRSLFVLLLFTIQSVRSQSNLGESKHLYLRGNSVLIGNNILGHHATKPMTDDAVPNDAIKMVYIDVDKDRNTFSSSQATVRNIPNNARIVYAALYWTALYPYEKGRLKQAKGKATFIPKGARDDDFDQILFKVPNQEYKAIKGDILKDGHGDTRFAETSPYVCRADVTTILQNLKNKNGEYTVANVKAAEGRVTGGGSAGWLLYVVYEDDREPLRYFTSYDGLAEINKEKVDLNLSGFKGSQEGNIRANLGIGALEGDRKIATDQLLMLSKKNGEFVAISNKLRSENNFFVSSITTGDEVFMDRNPSSSNTLGFDLLTLEVPNENQEFFDEKTTRATLRFQTRLDRFYLFFVSFDVDIAPDLDEIPENRKEAIVSELFQKDAKEEARKKSAEENNAKNREEEFASEEDAAFQYYLTHGKRKARYLNLTPTQEKLLIQEIASQEDRFIPGVPSGYYLVTNVFAVPNNARRWREFLISKDFTPATFINPENNWEYIYTHAFNTLEDGFKVWKQHQDKEYFVGLWLMKVNMNDSQMARN